jgi:hypothetical protein
LKYWVEFSEVDAVVDAEAHEKIDGLVLPIE